MIIAKQSTARTVMIGPILDADGVAVTDGVVADLKISKNGGAPAALNGSATLTHRHTGFYSLALTATDLDTVGTAEVTIDDTVNSCAMKEIQVIEEAIYDAIYAASANAWTGAAGSTTLTALASGSITAAVIATGAIDADAIADNAIDAGAIAADAFTAAKFAADVTTELQSGLATAAELAKVPKSDSNVTWNATALASIQSEANDALVAYDPPTKAELDAAVANVSVDEIQPTALADLFNTDSGTGYVPAVAGSVVKEIADNALKGLRIHGSTLGDTGNSTTTLNLVEFEHADDELNGCLLSIYDDSAAQYYSRWIEDWNATTNIATVAALPFTPQDSIDYIRVFSIRRSVTAAQAAEISTTSTNVTAILADTNELQTDWTNGGRLDLIVDAILADTNELQTDWVNGGRLDLILDARASQASVDALNNISTGDVNAEVTAVIEMFDLDHLITVAAAGTEPANNSLWARLHSKSATADYSSYDNTTDSVQALRDNLATASALTTAQNDLDILTGTDGVTLATSQPNYAPATATALASLVTTVGAAGAGLTAADDAVIAAIAALNNVSTAQVTTSVTTALTTALTEGYRGTNATGSVRDILYEMLSVLTQASITTTTLTGYRIDGTTVAKTYTLNSATTPTSITETT